MAQMKCKESHFPTGRGSKNFLSETYVFGRTGSPVPKEQPPQETLRQKDLTRINTLESDATASAEGITISGAMDRGGIMKRAIGPDAGGSMSDLKRTGLYDLHVELGAKMVPFAGYEMPVQYPLGVMKEHLWTRENAGLFDVSHMGQVILRGEGVGAAFEALVPMDVQGLTEGRQRYGLFRDDESINELSDYMVMRLKEKISTNKRIVDEPSDSTLRLSIAISNVETPNPILAVTSSVLPFGIGVSTISKLTTGEHTNVGEATIELLVSDSKTAEPIFAVIDRHVGDKDLDNIVDGLSGAKDAIDWWVNRLFVTFDNQVTQI